MRIHTRGRRSPREDERDHDVIAQTIYLMLILKEMKPNVSAPAGQTLTHGILAQSLNLLLPAASNMAAGATART